jgi:hypothetical protein
MTDPHLVCSEEAHRTIRNLALNYELTIKDVTETVLELGLQDRAAIAAKLKQKKTLG